MSFHEKTTLAALGKWKGILLQLGLPAECLTGKHTACPMCGGEDRFRFDNKERKGTYICGQCGAGDGMKLAGAYLGRPFSDVASQIDRLLGNVTMDTPGRPEMTDGERTKALRAVFASTSAVVPGDLVDTYLTSRRVGELVYPKALRFSRALADGDGGVRPCMVAMVKDASGKPVTLHRTFLRPDGLAKAEMTSPRKLMPGTLPDACAVPLSDFAGGALGIAEGIETAMSASGLFSVPVWAAMTAGMMVKWWPPDGCDEVVIFGDNDASFTGQAAAYGLARRLRAKGIAVTVHIPVTVGEDWNDVIMRGGTK